MKKTFKEFLILDYFTSKKGNQKQMNTMTGGHTPLVSAKKIDNGYKDFVDVDCKDLFMGHCITLNNDGDGGAGMAFYQPADFALDSHVTALYPKQNLSKYQMIYIANCISKQRILFGHGRSINSTRLAHLICMLPVTPDGTPDYEYMEQYMRRIEKQLLERYSRYLEKKGFNLLDNNFTGEGSQDKAERWELFKIGDLFSALRPLARSENDYFKGEVPFVASGAVNNGVTKFCRLSDDENTDRGYCITVSPVDGSCHYHEYDFLGRGGAGSSIVILYPKDMMLGRYIALFIVKCISQTTKLKYSYGLMASKERLMSDVFQLPVTPDGSPDYKFMEQYMREIEQKIIHRYIEYRLKNV